MPKSLSTRVAYMEHIHKDIPNRYDLYDLKDSVKDVMTTTEEIGNQVNRDLTDFEGKMDTLVTKVESLEQNIIDLKELITELVSNKQCQ